MNKVELAWDTFNFYSSEIAEHEAVHIGNMNNARSFILKNSSPTRAQIKRVKSKCLKTIDSLLVLYCKQMKSLDDLINLHSSMVDIPQELDINIEHLMSLKNVTGTLIEELTSYKNDIDDLLN